MAVALEQWCRETEIPSALEPVGSLKKQQIPKALDGMMGALMLQGSEMGEDIEEALEAQNLRLPELPYRVCQFSLDDPRIENLRGKKRYYCRLGMYRWLQDYLTGTLEHTVGGFLVLMMGGLFAVLYTDPEADYIYDACKQAVDTAMEQMDFQVHVSISSLWTGAGRMESAYRMLRDVEQSREFYTGAIVHGSHRQHDMHMRVSVAFVVDGKIRNHTTRNKLLQAVITDQRFIFFPGQLSRQCCDDAAGKLRVPLALDLFNGIPQHLPIHVLRRCVRWQKNALCHNLR